MAPPSTFGSLLRHLRKRAGMTQNDLAAAVGYSGSLICELEQARRVPVLKAVQELFVPALGLQDEPLYASRLIELAALARGARPPAPIPWPRQPEPATQEQAAGRHSHLPALPVELLGRDADVDQLCLRLLGHVGRLLTLIGPPGIGKTTLALAVAARMQGHYRDGIVFVPLAAADGVEVMASAIGLAVGAHGDGSKPPQTRLVEFLRRKHCLLVLDNLEQIAQAGALVATLLAECPELRILATSRERLHLRSEQRYQVKPLELAAAVELFTQRAQAVEADFLRTPANQPVLEAICLRLDCLPLALELCAALVDMLAPAEILAQLQTQLLELLVDGAQDLPPRQRTLRSLLLHSYALLNAEERRLLRHLGVFAGGFDLEEVQAMGGTPAILHGLVGKSLVRVQALNDAERRYHLLETIREFAAEQLRANDEEAQAQARHFAILHDRFHRCDRHLRGPDYLAWIERLKQDGDNLRAAQRWAIDAGHYADAAWLMVAGSYFWTISGNGYEEATWLAQLLPHRQGLSNDLQLAYLLTFYRAAFALDEYQPMAPYMDEIRQLLPGCPYNLLHAVAWNYRAWTAGDANEAAACLEQSVQLARAGDVPPELPLQFGALADHKFNLAVMLFAYAALLVDQGRITHAAAAVEESLGQFEASGNRTGIAECLGIRGRVALLQGDLGAAHRCFAEAVAIATTLNLSAIQREWQALLAITTLYLGDAPEARRLLLESLQRGLDQKNTFVLAQVFSYLAEVALAEGQLEQAEHLLAQSLSYDPGPQHMTVYAVERLLVIARLAAARHEYARAAMLFGLAEHAQGHLQLTMAGPMRSLADAALASVRGALDPADFAAAFAAGRHRLLEDVLASGPALAHGSGSAAQAWPPVDFLWN